MVPLKAVAAVAEAMEALAAPVGEVTTQVAAEAEAMEALAATPQLEIKPAELAVEDYSPPGMHQIVTAAEAAVATEMLEQVETVAIVTAITFGLQELQAVRASWLSGITGVILHEIQNPERRRADQRDRVYAGILR